MTFESSLKNSPWIWNVFEFLYLNCTSTSAHQLGIQTQQMTLITNWTTWHTKNILQKALNKRNVLYMCLMHSYPSFRAGMNVVALHVSKKSQTTSDVFFSKRDNRVFRKLQIILTYNVGICKKFHATQSHVLSYIFY